MLGTGLTAIGTGIALFVALWRVQGNRFEAAESANRERFKAAESANRERFEAMDRRWVERFDMAEKRNQAAHAAICDSIGRIDRRLDELYRHLVDPRAKTGPPPAPAAG